jgi:hypothetical protein
MSNPIAFESFCSLQKVAEGGTFTQKDVKSIARELGIKCRVGSDLTLYVGQFGVDIATGTPFKLQEKFLKRLGL